jgi:hypothetical protein
MCDLANSEEFELNLGRTNKMAESGTGNTGVVAILVIFVILVVGALLVFGSRMLNGNKRVDVNIQTPAK